MAEKTARLAVDIGGTFTDIVLETDKGRSTLKVLTTHDAPERAILEGSQELLDQAGIRNDELEYFVHGTTLATNALIERKGAKTALIMTEGFRDTIEIADESRYNQYDLMIERPAPLAPRDLRFTVPERLAADGSVLLALDENAVSKLARTLVEAEVASVAVCLIHAYANGTHERRVRQILNEEAPQLLVSISSEVSPEIREYERCSTVTANAYVRPLMAGYLDRLEKELANRGTDCPLYLMTSGGGLTTLRTAAEFPIRLVESGPAGGAIMAAHVAAENGIERALSFDMGGTTAKICLIDDHAPTTTRTFEIDRRDRFMKGSGFPVRVPVIEMVEIGAGGGSIARLDAMKRLTVGPDSAGSEPGPICYGRGGHEPTVTDADLTLGKIDPKAFAAGRIELDTAGAQAGIKRAVGEVFEGAAHVGAGAISEIVDEAMANAARVHAVEGGRDLADYTMVAFGGAAPLHIARLAEKLGIEKVIIPPDAGVGSAVGFLRAPISFEVVRSKYAQLGDFDHVAINEVLASMSAEAQKIVSAGAGDRPLKETATAFMRYLGQGHEVSITLPNAALDASSPSTLRVLFEKAYARLFSRTIPGAEIEVLTWTVLVETKTDVVVTGAAEPARYQPDKIGDRNVYDPARKKEAVVPVYWRHDLKPGAGFSGPAILSEKQTTTVVSAAFDAHVNARGCIVLTRKTEV
ncbi:N-methylhydantoinase A [Sinorhizobium fredii]|uniref:Hydantoin utilization protein A n=1 Tax=Sinorhizobium fredii (strain USDA 257) TaxID=1185652 RepID=I3XBW4_SINF2|nr:hydantoinase/oxoprolinase family protein [Sinorhizobium fredii]AFL53370.1 hydantoin utilization protein A [Sinorhizobium fredii USDA 257]